MPYDPDLGGQNYEDFKKDYSEKIIEVFARYAPNVSGKNILGRYVYTGREYADEIINMQKGDIFMGAFNAEQVMYNHFGYRTPVKGLYLCGSGAHPGGGVTGAPGHNCAREILRDLARPFPA